MVRKVVEIDNSFSKYSLNPQAEVVDTYARPVAPAENSELMQLAAAMQEIEPSLQTFIKTKHQEQTDKSLTEGMKLYELEGNRQSWEDFVKKKPEFAKLNPWVREGYLKARADNEATILRQSMIDAYYKGEAMVDIGGEKVNIAESDDPAVFATWTKKFASEYVRDTLGEDIDPTLFSNVIAPAADKAASELELIHKENRRETIWNGNIAEHAKQITAVLDGAVKNGTLVLEGEGGYEALGQQITGIAAQMVRSGIPVKHVNRAVLDTIKAFAENNDLDDIEDIIDIANYVETTPGSYLGSIPEFKHELEELQDELINEAYYKGVREDQEEEKRKKERTEMLMKEYGIKYFDNPDAMPRNLKAQLIANMGLPEFSRMVGYLRNIDNTDGSSGSGGTSDFEMKFLADAAMGNINEYSVNDILSSNSSKQAKKSMLKALAGANKDVDEAVRSSQNFILNTINEVIFDGSTDLLGADAQIQKSALINASRAIKIRLKDNPDLLEDYDRLLQVVDEETRKISLNYQRNRDTAEQMIQDDPLVNSDKLLEAVSDPIKALQNFLTADDVNAVIESVRDYNSLVEKGEDTAGSDLERLIEALNKQWGLNITVEQLAEAYGQDTNSEA